jgi:ankyrin repeat protein
MTNQDFIYACRNGNLLLAKQLLEEYPDINISAKEEAYRYACKNKNLEMVRWLWLMINGY